MKRADGVSATDITPSALKKCPKITCADCTDLDKPNTQVINGQFLTLILVCMSAPTCQRLS